MKLKELVKEALLKKRMNQTELAERINITPAQISRILSGERGTTIETLVLIADVLGIKRDEILRAAAGLPSPEEENDEWVEDMNYKIKSLPKPLRPIAEKMLDALIEEPAPLPKLKKAKA
jgi:transcriptional regulator with XRE-family HTH domain